MLPPFYIFCRLDIGEYIILQVLELRLLLSFSQISIWQDIIAEAAFHEWIGLSKSTPNPSYS